MADPSLEMRVLTTATATARQRGMAAAIGAARGLEGVPWRFFHAVPFEDAGLRYDDAAALEARGRTLSAPELSCFASHYAIVRDWLAAGSSDYVLIAEDDIVIDPSFDFREAAGLMAATGMNYLRLYGRAVVPARLLVYWGRFQVLRFAWTPGGLQAFILSREGARRVVASVKAAGTVVRPIDDHLDRSWETGMPVYALHPWPVMEQNLATTIHGQAHVQARREAQERVAASRGRLGRLGRRAAQLRERLARKAGERRLLREDAAMAQRVTAFFQGPDFRRFTVGG